MKKQYSGPRDFKKQDWMVAPASLQDARTLVALFHYARGGSNTAVFVHGLYARSSGHLKGIAWWLPPTRVACESVNRSQWTRVLALTRMVMMPDVPRNACSFLLARAVDQIKQDGRFISLVTYADESQGHTGAVYRAANWTYVGRTGPYPRWIDPKTGQQVAVKATNNRRVAEMLAKGYVKQGSFHKHKYVLHLSHS